ncbi:hypothetical protein [Colwellia chukchiensis]|nr:hypothetical protein [Colwellia chukchiensis]
MPNDRRKLLIASYTWLRVALSYCVIGAIVTTLTSAYLQSISHIMVTSIMTVFCGFGVYKAEMTRRDIGLYQYWLLLAKQKHRDL